MTALDKQALRKEILNPAIGGNLQLRRLALSLLDENLQLQRDNDSLEAVAIALRDDMRDTREKLEAAERLITEWEQRELSNKRQLVINGLCESGEPFWEIDDYMKKWDAEHPREAAAAGIGVKGE